MNIGEAVKERILELCQEQDISINKLCNMSGVTQSTVNNIISGRNRSATVSTIKKLCDGLGITIEEFFHSDLFKDPGTRTEIANSPYLCIHTQVGAVAYVTLQSEIADFSTATPRQSSR